MKLLEDPKFKKMYGSLYQNVYPLKNSAYKVTTIFCVKRILLGLTTAYLNGFVLASIYVYGFTSLFSIGWFLNERPMVSKLMNFMENINELAIYISCYFMFLFTEWIPDVEMRYNLGFIYLPALLSIIAANFACVIYDMLKPLFFKIKRVKSKYDK